MLYKSINSFQSAKMQGEKFKHSVWLWVSFAVLTLIKLWLVSGQTLSANCDGIYDDRLFLNIANHLLNGHWLGPYNQLTLSKGMFYPLWIAATYTLGVPLLLSYHLLYIASCLILIIAVRPIVHRPTVVLLIYGILMFNPISYTAWVMPVALREGIYPALTLLVVGFAIGLLIRHKQQSIKLISWSIGLGLAFSAFWLTREESIWIMPLILLVIGLAAFKIWQKTPRDWRKLSLCILPFAIWLMSLGSVAVMNKIYYGIFTTVEYKSPAFLAAYGALSRVKHTHRQPTVPVPKETRERTYKVSPAFAELKPFLEVDIEKRWGGFLKSFRERYMKDPEFKEWVQSGLRLYDSKDIWVQMWNNGTLFSDEIHGFWFLWALRDAVAAAGYHSSGASAANYYHRLATEINAACTDGRLICDAGRETMMPPWHNAYMMPLIRTFFSGIVFLASFENFSVQPRPSEGLEESLNLFRRLTREPLFPAQVKIRGWAFSTEAKIGLSVSVKNGEPRNASIALGQQSEDVYRHFLSKGENFPNAMQSRFELSTYCASGCYLNITSGDRLINRLPLDGSIRSVDTPELRMYIDSFEYKNASLQQARTDSLKIGILERIGRGYQITFPILSGFGLIAYVIGSLRLLRKRSIQMHWIILTGLLIAIVTRLFLVSLIHVTSFPAISTRYLSPVYPLLLIFVIIALPLDYRASLKERDY